jgi:hypothetical protein
MSEDRVLDDRIQKALRALREADEEREASPELEARLTQAFRWRRQRVWRWAGLGIAAGIVGLVGLSVTHRPATHELDLAPSVPIASPAPPSVVVTPTPAKPRLAPRKPRPQLREIVTQFYPLMDTPPPTDGDELLRVSLPVSALERAGFVVAGAGPDDQVPADVLVGEEGLARAIRFVGYQRLGEVK